MTTPALLPLSGRRIPPLNLGPPSFPHHRATLRLSEKFILLLILSAFITLCFGAFFFLPDSSKHKRFDRSNWNILKSRSLWLLPKPVFYRLHLPEPGENFQISVPACCRQCGARAFNKLEQVLTQAASPWPYLLVSDTQPLPSHTPHPFLQKNSSLVSQFLSE